MKQHFQQIDILKGLAIVAVILLHSLTRQELENSYAVYHIWQAVPVFMVIMGLNLGLSLAGRPPHFRQLYTASYFQKKGLRILLPLLIMYAIALVAGYVWSQVYGQQVYTLSWENFIGVLPVSGKGNYFITLLLQSILLLPLIGYGFQRWPVRTTLVLLLAEVAFLLISYHISYFGQDRYLYDAAFFRYFTAIALGLWLSVIMTKRSGAGWFLGIAGVASAVYLYFHQYQGISLPGIRPEWQTQLFLTFPYAALLVFLFVLVLPQQSDNKALAGMARLGQASYHIFLVQVLYFGLITDDTPALQNLATCLLLGYLFFKLESVLSKNIAK